MQTCQIWSSEVIKFMQLMLLLHYFLSSPEYFTGHLTSPIPGLQFLQAGQYDIIIALVTLPKPSVHMDGQSRILHKLW